VTLENGLLRLQGSTSTIQGLPEDPRQLFIYKLNHARAPVLAATLQSLFGGGFSSTVSGRAQAQTLTAQLRSMNQGQQGPQIVVSGGGNQMTPFGAVVVPDEVTNSLLIRASPV